VSTAVLCEEWGRERAKFGRPSESLGRQHVANAAGMVRGGCLLSLTPMERVRRKTLSRRGGKIKLLRAFTG
jgi:hypothetical protein